MAEAAEGTGTHAACQRCVEMLAEQVLPQSFPLGVGEIVVSGIHAQWLAQRQVELGSKSLSVVIRGIVERTMLRTDDVPWSQPVYVPLSQALLDALQTIAPLAQRIDVTLRQQQRDAAALLEATRRAVALARAAKGGGDDKEEH
jgi:hypothetical protein